MTRFIVRGLLSATATLIVLNGAQLSLGATNCALGLVCVAFVIMACCVRRPHAPVVCPILANRDWLAHPWSREPIKLRPQWS